MLQTGLSDYTAEDTTNRMKVTERGNCSCNCSCNLKSTETEANTKFED